MALDAAGAVLAVALATLCLTRPFGEAGPQLLLLAAAVGALVAGRLLVSIHRAVPPASVVLAAGVVVAVCRSELIGTGPLGGPFGYENATGAFFVQAAMAGGMLVVAVRWWPVAILGIIAAVAFGFIAVQASATAAASLAVALVVVPVLVRTRWVRTAAPIAAALFLLVLTTTIVLGVSYLEGEPVGATEGTLRSVLTERRVALWHEALEILGDHPGGVGPGRFDEEAPTALADRDARWAHNAFLQQGAELGWVGLFLTVLLFLWGFARLWVHPAPDAVVALGAVSLAALGIHASVDYVLHFPAVPLAAAVLVGAAQAAPRRRSRDERHEPRQEGVEGDAHTARVVRPPATR